MHVWTAALLGCLVGAVIASAVAVSWFVGRRRGRSRSLTLHNEPLVPSGVTSVLTVLRSSALVVGPDDSVLKASAPAHSMGIVRGARVVPSDLLDVVHRVRRDGLIREEELEFRRTRAAQPIYIQARVAPIGSRLVLVLITDRTKERRVEAIRRDFVANVSHELKTPVGALSLLAEAAGDAADDADAVRHFTSRMTLEAERLTRLVQQIIELSRLEGDDPAPPRDEVLASDLAAAAIDRVSVDAQEKGIAVTFVSGGDLRLVGDIDQLVVAVGNLVENAVRYSPDGRPVVVAARERGSMVDINVTDRGVGIAPDEVDRIFERFYRVDPARHRATGGTGLGLSIVKHVALTHGGDIKVWSLPGEGSTFTLSIPAAGGGRSSDHVTEDVVPSADDEDAPHDTTDNSGTPALRQAVSRSTSRPVVAQLREAQ